MELTATGRGAAGGAFPPQWEVTPLGETCAFENGDRGVNYPSPGSFVLSGIPFVNAGHLAGGSISQGAMDFITPERFDRLGSGKFSEGDILFCLRGSLGKFGVVRPELGRGAIASSLVIVRPKTRRLRVDYLACYFDSSLCAQMITTWAGGAAQPNLGAQDLARFLIPLPPLPEQRAIAAALSDVDALIAKLDQLITKKRDLKQAAKQQLLTGKTRLPGFKGAWRPTKVGELGSFSKGKGIRKDQVAPEGLPCVRYGEIYTHHHDVIRQFYSHIPRVVAAESQRLTSGDLIFAGSGETAEEIGKCVAFVGHEEAYAGGDTVILSPVDHDSTFLAYLMNDPSVVRQKMRMGQGDAVVHISARSLAQIEVCLPEPPEQSAVAAVLRDMDTELTALETRREKTRNLKQGMMQELLTGRTRLV